ncbi:RsmB/NOP family class I SAM-dependent RNA methyltransferase [Laribacter hongkongensis]|uniref:RsmB/NOP family class I SAM-dependent RNA methyltransferase n=1 Tax=Laribacter hongkongensis TaxID=168471 RepID=A0ABD4SQQ3_9NEIS|nr:RsmB/NOP family class I SAM-dependent RNA methyltransferase [Laribacter hongkongensis]MCG9025839.1 RsmB/NOP family class I SAM-dependent RNA methyltransferase [Laribacter hongkongensis]MCG9100646.1 RsmB/NOP family class I SAM-dependent RNA methyltransferase [Laribacter hongkongensis]MCG9104464.1 RsmB/NOP family class I SAM-dependent RNA methyltransferase [Laribacter hongkongensis]MCG9112352.1 RsmB/NOP family class I SAM-dependent RNA methyltransferase [Laribacter hongkongensis]MCG9117432.1 
MAINPAQFDAVVDALRRVLPCERPADAVLSAYFRDMRKLGAQDRHLIAETIFAVLRRRAFLTALTAPSATPRRLVIASLIKVRGLNVRELDGILTEAEKKWVVELKAAHPELDLAGRAELPEWVVDALRAGGQDDDAIVALGHSMQNSAPLDLRANTLKMRREDVLAALRAAGLELAPTPFSPVGLRVKGKPPINRHPLFLEGAVEVQDEGSQLLGLLVGARRGEMVVDFCAGAGGKTLHLGAMMASRGRLYAFDVSEKRLANLKPRLARSGLSNVTPQLIQNENDSKIKRLAGKVDRVLVDAPCSGLGTLRRNPDLKFRQSPASIAELNKTQASILARAAQLVKPGGRLVYATCSVLPAENDAIVDAFLAAHPEFSETPVNTLLEQAGVALDTGSRLRLLPGVHSTDGFFAAVLTRTPPVNEQEVDEQENEPAEAVETAGPTAESE